jgi:DNA-binding transcriptional MerR regulator
MTASEITNNEERVRATDLARLGGISVQQVRNYVELGFLPPVRRTPAGYRIFTTEHAAALPVVRMAIHGHGWRRAREIMTAIHRGDVPAALAAIDAGHAELDRERAGIASVLAAFETATADSSPPAAYRQGARIGEVARAVGVRTPVLRLWERRGLLRPDRDRPTGYRVYDAIEFRNAHLVALLRRANYPFSIVHNALDELRTTGSPQRARSALAKREDDLHRRSRDRLAASAAIHTYLQTLP